MKQTPFTEKHIALGAKIAEFAGYNMPISYSSINEEHNTVRKSAGVFDVSHMGEFILKGGNALALIQKVTTNDASKLKNGQAQYSVLTNEQGGIIDDLLVYCIEEQKTYMLVVNAANIDKDWNWIYQHNTLPLEGTGRLWKCTIYLIKRRCWRFRAPRLQLFCKRLLILIY
ncbi:aminomethyltransferase family protein [Niabella ginsengisoli]|uniref:hypothetical protein n=1 Tax=Niabella ginsengisoli TaxID=522298 RepID=UPI0021D4766F|nr:hypothetical protein [Niabella ginsengisoli]